MTKYTIERHNQLSELNKKSMYVLWKEVNSEHGFCVRGIFQGSKKECEEKLKQIKGE